MPKITTPDAGLVAFRQDVHKLLRRRVLEAMEIVLEEELSEALGATPCCPDSRPTGVWGGRAPWVPLRCGSMVVAQHPAEPLSAFDGRPSWRIGRGRRPR